MMIVTCTGVVSMVSEMMAAGSLAIAIMIGTFYVALYCIHCWLKNDYHVFTHCPPRHTGMAK